MPTRRAFTLIEVLLVLAILAVVAGMAWPALLRFVRQQALKEAGQQVFQQLDQTRFEAIESGLLYRFLYEPDGRYFIALPAEAAPVAGTTTGMLADPMTAAGNPIRKFSGQLPEGVHFQTVDLLSDPAASPSLNQNAAVTPLAGAAGTAVPGNLAGNATGGTGLGPLGSGTLPREILAGMENAGELEKVEWSAPILYRPDGTSQDAAFRIIDESGKYLVFHIRGLTGMARASPPKQEAKP